MPSHTIVLQSDSTRGNQHSIEGLKCFITYSIAETLKFEEPHCARLLWIEGGTALIFFVLADFVKRQNVNGVLQPYLGCSVTDSVSSWVPLASNHIPQTGIITIVKGVGKTSIGAATKFSLSIEIAPESLIYGAQS